MSLLSAISFLRMADLELFSVQQLMWFYVGFEASSCMHDAERSCVVTRQRCAEGCQLLSCKHCGDYSKHYDQVSLS